MTRSRAGRLARLAATAALAAAAALASVCARAQSVAEFYRGKELRVLISHPPGGGYDAYGRLLARHIADHLPGGPAVVVQNMPGAAGIVMANNLAATAPRDGTMIALGPGALASAPLFGVAGARYDARKFSWLGSMNADVAVAVSWRTSPVQTADDLMKTELVVGGAGANDLSVVFPNALNRILGTRFKVIPGYGGSSENALALERGEVAGIGAWNYSSIAATRPAWLTDGSIHLLLQLALQPHPDLPKVPTVLDLARGDDAKAVLRLIFAQTTIGRVVLAPPDVPAERVTALREAFRAMLDDPAFKEDAQRAAVEINQPMDGAAVTTLIADLYGTDSDLVRRAAEAVTAKGAQ